VELNRQASKTLAARRREIAQAVTSRHFEVHPELDARYGASGREKCLEDAKFHLGYLEQAVARSSAQIFLDYVAWARIMLEYRGIPETDFADHLRTLAEVVREMLPGEQIAAVDACLAPALGRPPAAMPASAVAPDSAAQRFLEALQTGGTVPAGEVVRGLMRSGLSLHEIYVDVIQPSLHEIGRLWQINRVSVAEEHYLTAAIQLVIAQLSPQLFGKAPTRPSVVIACVPGELHEIGARMVADLLQLEGFDSHFLGASTPIRDLVAFVVAKRTAALGLSTTISSRLAQTELIVHAIRADARTREVKIVVGGGPFVRVAGLWRTVGADAFAANARHAIEVFGSLVP
jgi:MerR family transcriptional regulator, light-induced transcriptional regulator